MNKFRFTFKVLAITIFMFAFASLAQGQAFRTWVSGVGDDANPCSRTAPCKTFAGSISKTAAFGQINCLDPGGFGAVTIVKSITIICEEETGHIEAAGVNAINVILPNSTDRVTLRGLDIDGATTGINGISFTGAGTLTVQETLIRGFTQNGINFAPNSGTAQLHVSENSVIANNNGGNISFAGILIKPISGASANVSINGVQFENNANGIFADGSGGGGTSNVTVKNSRVSGSSNCGIVFVSNGAAFSGMVDSTMISLNGFGVAIAGSAAALRLGSDTITHNVTGVSNSGGTLQSFKNNQIVANITDGAPIPPVSVSGNILN
jgi:hypothetical protein